VTFRYLSSFPTRRSSDLVTAHELGSDVFGQVCRTEFEAQHKSDASNVDDVFVARCEFCKLFVEEFADVVDVFEETVSFDGVDDRSEEHTSELQSPYDLVC